MLSQFYHFSRTINTKMSNSCNPTSNFDSNIKESLLSSITRNQDTSTTEEKTEWQNVQNAELKFLSQKNLGKWQEDQTKQANACS
jgi:hypothetical protein